MFEAKIGDPGWSPFIVTVKPVQSDRRPDPSKAKEVTPIIARPNYGHANVQPTGATEDEAEASAETDPKASSAISSVSVSSEDSNPSGTSQTPDQTPIHPSSLPPEAENPVSAEKELKTSQASLILTSPMSLGPNAPSAEDTQ